MISFLLAFGLGAGARAEIPAQDEQFGCVEIERAERYQRDFHIRIAAFGGRELCRNEIDAKKLFNDLRIVEEGRFRDDGTHLLIGGFVPSGTYFDWLRSMTRGIDRANNLPFATAYNSSGFFTMQDGWSRLCTLGRVGTIIHEARHTEGFRHIPCTQGAYAGDWIDACDTDFTSGGSHAVEMEYYARVAVRGENFHPVYQSMARLMAAARANFAFNRPVLRTREGILALNRDSGALTLFDGDHAWPRETPLGASAPARLKRSSAGATLFDGTQAFAVDLYQTTNERAPLKDVYSYFKLLDRITGPMRDLEEFDAGPRRHAAVVDGTDRLAFFNFPEGRWEAWKPLEFHVARSTTALPDGRRGWFLIAESGDVHPVSADRQAVGPADSTWNPAIQDVVFNGSELLLLGVDGRFRTSQGDLSPLGDGQTWSSAINVPLYDAFEVNR